MGGSFFLETAMTNEEEQTIRALTKSLKASTAILEIMEEKLIRQNHIVDQLTDMMKKLAEENCAFRKNATLELMKGSLKQCHN